MKKKVIKYCRIIHRYLSYFFAGVILIYAISGLTMNHLKDFNPKYSINQIKHNIEGDFPREKDSYTKEEILEILKPIDEDKNYTKHYYPDTNTLKVFMKDGSSLTVDLKNGDGKYESIKKRPFFSQISTLHYNPGKWWTTFSDIFAISLIIITITGMAIVRGKKGFIGIGGVLFISGLVIPILFLLLM